MASNFIEEGHEKASKKRKKKYQSPFRIKIGCLVALRYRPRGNNVSIVGLDDVQNEKLKGAYWEPVRSARFSEVWTDPQKGRDDGLALIGSRIRCFFPKAVLSEPYNAVSRLLEGTVVNVVVNCDNEAQRYSSIMVDLLVDNKDDELLSVTLPFLKRLDGIRNNDPVGKSEQRRRQYEEQIKGGKHKAVVRVSLMRCGTSHIKDKGKSSVEAKWVIRKRVPTKISRRQMPVPVVKEVLTSTNNGNGENEPGGKSEENSDTSAKIKEDVHMVAAGENGGKYHENAGQTDDAVRDQQASALTEPERKKSKNIADASNTTTSLNKDFSLPVYLGDGNDSAAQQEGNWRWEAGRYHNPYVAAFADHPISKEMLKPLSYNFVGEVVSIQPAQSLPSKIDTLAMVTIRLMVLPEHTRSGRLMHHGPSDLFDISDFNRATLSLEEENVNYTTNKDTNSMDKEQDDVKSNIDITDECLSTCLLRVPIEELVIVHRQISCDTVGSREKNDEETTTEQSGMALNHSYSFISDTYNRFEYKKPDEEEKSGAHRCRRCQHSTSVNKRLAGVPHTLCEVCTEDLKSSGPFYSETYGGGKSKRYRCECDFCADRRHADLLADLANEVLEAESKLGSTLQDLENYSADKDSGFIATRFVMKGINPVDFSISSSSLASFMTSTSSKPITKIKARLPKGTKKSTSKKSIRDAGKIKSPSIQIKKRPFPTDGMESIQLPVPRNEPFRSTSARLLPYDTQNRKFDVSAAELYQWRMFRSSKSDFPEKPRNLRQFRKLTDEGDLENEASDKKKLQGRAARAKQRRLLRSVAAMGVDVDTLATRESNIRFDRSNIHGWGVFTDVDIRQGEMIIEYRGDRIGNAVAEKREKEYEAAKIGSDYMFRVDEYTICDATKQGNVARFINASCSPNCYPKIISLDGCKRIVVYAKRDIRAGEELCYDYKFDLEYDPAKRIPCICGSPDCRGFLNWDDRYVAISGDGSRIATSDKKKNEDVRAN